MNILRYLETTLATHLGSAVGITFYAGSDTAEMGAKPYGVVTATMEGRKGTQRNGQIDCCIYYNPTQGTDSNGTGNSIFDLGDILEDRMADNESTLNALNAGTSYLYQIVRFASGAITPDGDRSRKLEVSAYWSAFHR